MFIRRSSYERAGLLRAAIDRLLGTTADEFRVEDDLVAIGPIYDEQSFAELVEEFEREGLEYYEDFFELSGNWPAWLSILASSSSSPGRSKPSHPQ